VIIAHQPTVDEEGGAGYIGCVVGGKEGDHGGDIFGGAEAAEGNVREEGVEFGLVFKESFV